MLESYNVEVVHAERGKDGINILENSRDIDVALIDYSGALASGRLIRGDNPVLMTFELVLEAR